MIKSFSLFVKSGRFFYYLGMQKLAIHPLADSTSFAISVDGVVQAGFPSPANDHMETPLNLHDLMVSNPPATFFVRVSGDSMLDARIEPGDILVVDRSLEPSSGKIVVAILNGEFTVKRIRMEGGKITLLPENPDFPEIPVEEGSDFQVWGVVTYIVHKP